MRNIRNRIETQFEDLGRFLYGNRWKVIIVTFLVFGALVTQLPKIKFDLSTEGFLHEDDKVMIEYNEFRDQFGRAEMVIVAIRPPAVFDIAFLQKLKTLHEELEDNVPYLDEITSLINARNTRGKKDELIVEDLLEDFPETEADLAALKNRVMGNPLYENLIISEDGRFTTIMIQTLAAAAGSTEDDVLEGFSDMSGGADSGEPNTGDDEPEYLTDAQNSEVVRAVERIVQQYDGPDFKTYIAGSPSVVHFLKRAMMRDIQKFMAVALVTITVVLFLMFHTVEAVVIPLLVVILSLVSTISLMAATGVPIKLPTQILPSFLVAVGVGDAVHILAVFYHRLRGNGDKREATAYALGHSGLAVMMTSLTTAGGLLSFSTADIAPIASLGIFSAVGVTLALLYTVVLLPPLLSIAPVKVKKAKAGTSPAHRADALLTAIGRFATGRPVPVLGVAALIIAFSIVGITRVRFSHHVLQWFPENSTIRTATETIDRELNGSVSLEAVIDTEENEGFHNPDRLKRLDETAAYMETLDYGTVFVGKAFGLNTVIKEIHQALNENREAYYKIPDNRRLVAQEFLLFENSGSDDLEDLTDNRFTKARLTIKVPFTDAVAYSRFIDDAETHIKKAFPESKVTLTGMTAIFFRTITNVITSMAKSYTTALVVITFLMILLIGRVKIGALSMVPNLFPILCTIGLMGWFNLPMDLFTMLVGSIAIGLAVDDTVHFMHNFRRYFEQSNDAKWAVMETLHTTGRAMLVTTVVLSMGFFVFMMASMNNLFRFGWLTGFTIVMALLSDYFIAPALMVLANRGRSATDSPKSEKTAVTGRA